jgi:hypothetical protein
MQIESDREKQRVLCKDHADAGTFNPIFDEDRIVSKTVGEDGTTHTYYLHHGEISLVANMIILLAKLTKTTTIRRFWNYRRLSTGRTFQRLGYARRR